MKTPKQRKENSLNILDDLVVKSSCIFVINYKGISAKDFYEMRRKVTLLTGEKIVVAKNSVIKLAIKKSGLSCFLSGEILNGQNAAIFTNKPIEIASILSEYQKKSLISISAYSDKISEFDSKFILDIAKFKDANGLKSCLLGLLKEPCSGLARVLSQKVNIGV